MKNLPLHFFYVSGILITIIIILITINWSADSNTVSYLSFGATLTSLFLGLIAIFYSIVSNNNLNESFTKLSDTSANLSIASLSLISNAENLKILLSQIPILEGKIDESNLILKNISEKKEDNFLVTQTENLPQSNSKLFTKENIEQLLLKSSIYGLICIYLCNKSYLTRKAFNLFELLKLNNESSAFLYSFGYIVAIQSTGIIEATINEKIFNVYFVDKILSESIEKYLVAKFSQQGEKSDYYIDFKNKLDDHFK